jgi:hypothetical protein
MLSVALVTLVVSSCGDKSNPVSAGGGIVGTWNMTTMAMAGVTVAAGTSTMTVVENFNSNNSFRQIMVDYESTPVVPDTETGTWSASGNRITLMPTGSTVGEVATYTLAGNTLNVTPLDSTGASSGLTMTFARQ